MSAPMTPDEIQRGLMALGVKADKAQRAAGFLNPTADLASAANVLRPAITFPIRVTLPWSALCSDNDKYGAVIRGSMEKPYPKLILTATYRAAKETSRRIAQGVMGEILPLAQPLALTARVHVPNNRPGHDVANFAKCAHDAFERVLYVKDEWLHDIRWIRAGVDVDHPRAELTITSLSSPASHQERA